MRLDLHVSLANAQIAQSRAVRALYVTHLQSWGIRNSELGNGE